MKVKIKIYNFELESMLDRLQFWGSNYDWGGVSGHPNIEIELDVLPDPEGLEKKYVGDRFDDQPSETTNSDSILDMLKKRGPSLSDFVKEGK